MATYVLIHAAAVDAWYWGPLAAELKDRGHEVVAPDLPCDDESAGLAEYTETVIEAIDASASGSRGGSGSGSEKGKRDGQLVVVAHSFGGFTGPLVCERVGADLLVMLQAMVPRPGEAPGQWWENTGYGPARAEADRRRGVAEGVEEDPRSVFLHDTPDELADEFTAGHERTQTGTPMMEPWPLDAWPDVPTRFLLSSGDRFFPAPFLRAVVADRLGIEPDEMPGDHSPMLAHPKDVAERLEAYRTAL
jgi:hypothetical protein